MTECVDVKEMASAQRVEFFFKASTTLSTYPSLSCRLRTQSPP